MLDEIFDSSLDGKVWTTSLKLSNNLKTKTSLLYLIKAIWYLTSLLTIIFKYER